MKLWQKIFLCTLLIVILSVSFTSILLLKNSYETSINQQSKNIFAEHEYLISNIKISLLNERQNQNSILLSQEQIIEYFIRALNVNDTKEKTSVFFYDTDGKLLYTNSTDKIENILFNSVMKTDMPHQMIYQKDDSYYLQIASPVIFEKCNYIFITSTDISSIYETYQEQFDFTKWFSIIISLLCALFLLFLIKLLLLPLGRLNSATKQIADGNYLNRINVRGNSELSELAHNMNRMTDSIEKNINLLSETAMNRKQFIDNLTHEMKTPLTSILGFSDIIRIKPDISSEELAEYNEIIFEEANRLKSLSGKLMELITVDETNLDFVCISATELFRQIKIIFKPILDKNDISLICECDEYNFFADAELFKSMLSNIIDNAIKASKNGDSIYFTGKFKSDDIFEISIWDEGIGIEKEDLDKIIEPFYMVDKARSRQAGGAGLGLALCKSIADIHNADIKIDSTIGVGTTVTIILSKGGQNEA